MSCETTLTACELAEMAADATAGLPDTATLYRPEKVDDGQGGRTVTWNSVAGYACAVLPNPQRREREEANRVASDQDWLIRLPLGTDVRTKDRLVVSGFTYDVQGRDTGRSFAVAVDTFCRRLD